MLKKISELPTDKRIAGVHCVPITADGNIVMAWDKEEQVLTTIGGRIEGIETLEEALDRELMEEVG
ncbi:NUDIX domain-containing protein [Heyndrickxia camelliae]|uniref:NUDIX domain-containing protein n=1 Tax=Heyndrickxia camelliae TaxID=1707093 RepID=UPI001F1D4C0D|nr:NUDIX domain-containing protein [Heyndrickxia camelliae]